MLCVALAGLFFIPAVLLNYWYLIIIGAFFDWLPLPTGWMKAERVTPSRNLVVAHIVTTLIAYTFAIIWIVSFYTEMFTVSRFLFMEIWWIAVILGIFIER